MPFSLDPESMRGKLLLLVVDKLVIGAILAGAFFVYDNWRTQEVREYNAILQDSQDEFKRAEFIKELIPIVLNTEKTIQTRIEVLGSLIRTESIDPSSAVALSLSLLREGKLVYGDNYTTDPVLVDSFVRMLGPIVPEILPQILDAYDDYPSISEAAPGHRAPSGYKAALIAAFEYAWRNYPAEALKVLDDPVFVAEKLGDIADILPQAHVQHREWNEAAPLALRLIRDIQLIRNAREENETVVNARRRLSQRLRVTSGDAEEVRLSTALFFEMSGPVSDTQFIRDAFAVIMQPNKVAEVFNTMLPLTEKRDPFSRQFRAASGFLLNASVANPEAEALAIPVVEGFLEKLQSEEVDFGNFPIERTMVCVLVRAVEGADRFNRSSERAKELLEALAMLPDKNLRAANLGFLIHDPIASLPPQIKERIEASSSDERARLVAETEARALKACGMNLERYNYE